MKKFLLVLIGIISTAILTLTFIAVWNNLPKVTNKIKIGDNIIFAPNNTEQKAEEETKVSILIKEIENLNAEITILTEKNAQDANSIQSLITSGEHKDAEIDNLNNELSSTQERLNQINQDLQSKTAELENIKSENTIINDQVVQLSNTIIELQATIDNLNYQVDYYEQLLKAYENNELIATFRVNNSVHVVQLVKKNASPTKPEDPAVEHKNFLGWSLDGVNVIDDVSSVIMTEDTTFIAIFEDIVFTVTFNDGSNSISQEVVSGRCPLKPEDPIKENYSFKGWSTDGENIVEDIANFQITEDTTFTAIFETLKFGLFNDSTNALIMSWDQLLQDGAVVQNQTTLSSISNLLGDKLVIPDTITEIACDAGCGSSNLKLLSIVFPSSLKKVGPSAFYNNTYLREVYFEDGQIIEGGIAMFGGCTSLTKVVLGNRFNKIADSMFNGCTSLRTVDLPETITEIEEAAFSGCKNLRNIAVPNNTVSIRQRAFYDCPLLKIFIPESVEVIEDAVFKADNVVSSSYSYIYCEAATKPELWNSNWYNSLHIFVHFNSTYEQYLEAIS